MDRVTQLQDAIDAVSLLFFTAIGALQRDAALAADPAAAAAQGSTLSKEDHAEAVRRMALELAEDLGGKYAAMRDLISALPRDDIDVLAAQFEALEAENEAAGRVLEATVVDAEKQLTVVQEGKPTLALSRPPRVSMLRRCGPSF